MLPVLDLGKNFTGSARKAGLQAWERFRFVTICVALLWLTEVASQVWSRSHPGFTLVDVAGIYPRSFKGLPGVFLACFVHRGFGELLRSTLPLLLLGWMVALGGRRLFFKVSGLIVAAAGLTAWLAAAAPGPYSGAGGLVYGYLGFLLVRGFLEPSVRWVVVSVLVGVLYATALGGFLPDDATSSTALHLGGFFGGIGASWLLFYKGRTPSPSATATEKP